MNTRDQIEEKVKQVIYGGSEYDAGDVFDPDEYTRAKRMLGDYAGHPNADPVVKERAEAAIEQIDA